MNFYIIIPAHNEQNYIAQTLMSLTEQTLQAKQLIVVADNCTDHTLEIAKSFAKEYPYIKVVSNESTKDHLPGSKVINAFHKGLDVLDNNYDVLCKFDADLIFPINYLETLAHHFNQNKKLGMVGGFCYVEQDNQWVLENLTNKDHIRGALKAYRKQCFKDIGQLKTSIGWDTVDELLAKFNHWEVKTDATLKVKHLKPTGSNYNKTAKLLQGEAMYKMRYGYTITLISALKIAFKKKQFAIISDYLKGFLLAKKAKVPFLVTKDEGAFIRDMRWRGIFKKLMP